MNKGRITVLVVLIFCLITGFIPYIPFVAADVASTPMWPMFHYNAQRTGQCPYDTSENAGTMKWQFMTVSGFLDSPTTVIASDGTVYVSSNSMRGSLYALDPNGTVKWKFKTEGFVFGSLAIADSGTIYVGTIILHRLYALNPDGTLKWKILFNDPIISSPAIASDGTIYVGSDDNYLYAFNPDGTLKWRFKADNGIRFHPAIASDGTIYVGSRGNYLYALNPDGTLKWKFEAKVEDHGAELSAAIASDGTIYVGSRGNYLYALNPDGTLKWKFEANNIIISSPAIASDGTIYVGSRDNYLYALNPDGTLKWKFRTGGGIEISSPVIASEGTIYVGSKDNYFYALNPDGTLKWKFRTGNGIYSSPSISSDGTVYIGSDDGYLYAIGSQIYTCTTTTNVGGLIKPSGDIHIVSGKPQTFTIVPEVGYHIKDVMVDGISVGAVSVYTFASVTANHTIRVAFDLNAYSLTATAGLGGSISPSGVVSASFGGSQLFTINPSLGYHIKDVMVDGISVGAVSVYTFTNVTANHTLKADFEKDSSGIVIVIQVNNANATIVRKLGSRVLSDTIFALDSPPVIKNGRTLVPIRAIIEMLGGSVDWDGTARKATVALGDKSIELWIGKSIAKVNGASVSIDSANAKVVPEIINGRTMLPLRFISENLGCSVIWTDATKTITITYVYSR